MLFVCTFEDLDSLLVDAEDLNTAIGMATDVADGEKPRRVTELPKNFFVAALFTEDEDGFEVVVDPLDPVVAALDKIDGIDAEPSSGAMKKCGDENKTDDDEDVTCDLVVGHGNVHEATTSSGVVVTW